MKLSILLTCSMLLGCRTTGHAAPASHEHSTAHTKTAPPAVHGMVIFGSDTLYASHIPMFMVPHDWQAHFEISLEHAEVDANKMFKEISQTSSSQGLYTFMPKPFVLPDLLSGKIKTFSGDLFKGNFEAGGEVILSNLKVIVTKVMNVSQLETTNSPSETLNYVVVGGSNFLAHKIVAPESFDQLVEVKWLKGKPELFKNLHLNEADSLENSLAAGQFYRITSDNQLLLTPNKDEADMQVIVEFSCTRGPDFFEPCK